MDTYTYSLRRIAGGYSRFWALYTKLYTALLQRHRNARIFQHVPLSRISVADGITEKELITRKSWVSVLMQCQQNGNETYSLRPTAGGYSRF